jgi:hypothetical protein
MPRASSTMSEAAGDETEEDEAGADEAEIMGALDQLPRRMRCSM